MAEQAKRRVLRWTVENCYVSINSEILFVSYQQIEVLRHSRPLGSVRAVADHTRFIRVLNGDVDGVIIDSTSAAAYEQEFAGELSVGITGLSSDPLGLVFQEGDELQDAFNVGLAAIKADGTLDKLVLKWWPK